MLPNFNRVFIHAALLLAALALPAQAQYDVRGTVAAPPPQAAPGMDASGKAASGKTGAGAAAGAQSNATAAKTGEAQSKFPNKDTAKNRKDYDMGTGTGGIQLGRDEATGDTVLRHNPPKKPKEPSPYDNMPIEVRPIIVR
jgi:uncharacterized low-complexity protein